MKLFNVCVNKLSLSLSLIIVDFFFTVGSVKFFQLSLVILAGEELTIFEFSREECEKNFENHWSSRTLSMLDCSYSTRH